MKGAWPDQATGISLQKLNCQHRTGRATSQFTYASKNTSAFVFFSLKLQN